MDARIAIAVVTAGGMAWASPAVPSEGGLLAFEQRAEVTASRRVPGTTKVAAPVTVITAEQIAATGLTSIGDVLRQRSFSDSLGRSNVSTQVAPFEGTETASLRGLGANRTLVLVNGRRWLALGDGQVDLTQIPISLVQRIEVLGEGASAIHGSDAVAGVINIILRRGYDGLEVEMATGGNFKGDAGHRAFGVTLGAQHARSGLAVNITKREQDPIFAGDREISRFPVAFMPTAMGSAFGEFGVFQLSGNRTVCLDPAADQSITDPAGRTVDDFIPFTDACRYNYAPAQYLLRPSDRLTAFANGSHALTESVRASVDFAYSRRRSEAAGSAAIVTTGLVGGPQWNFPVSADNLYNPFGEDIIGAGFRITPLGERRPMTSEVDTYVVSAGLDGHVTVRDRAIAWDLVVSRGESSQAAVLDDQLNLLHLRRGLGPSHIDPVTGMPTCGTLDAPTPVHGATPCVPVNLFSGVGGWTREMLDYVAYSAQSRTHSGMRAATFGVAGDAFDLPAGAVAFAAGIERRSNTFAETPDALAAAGLSSLTKREPTAGEQDVREAYVEFGVPLLSGAAFARTLEATLALRTSRYEHDGTFDDRRVGGAFSNDAFSAGLLWQPSAALLLRAGVSDVFRAPSVADLYRSLGEGVTSLFDPCTPTVLAITGYFQLTPEQRARCHAQGVPVGGAPPQTASLVRTMAGGNPTLEPERGRSTTVGVVYEPGFVAGLDLSVDVWRVTLDDALSFADARTVLESCILLGDPVFCVPDDPTLFVERAPDGTLLTVRPHSFNRRRVRVSGADVRANYRIDTAAAGSFVATLNATWTREAQVTAVQGGPSVNVVGQAVGAFGAPTWRWRANHTLEWHYGDVGVTWTMRYLSSLVETCSPFFQNAFQAGIATRPLCSNPTFNRVGARLYHDLSTAWRTPWNAVVGVGVRNLFDRHPPFMLTSSHSFDPAYDLPGSFWFVRYRQAL